ncbi:hypothetical protein VE25_18350 [Devosia geojensis]|uniref:Uncharacterized protein n=1 Tax=Devosia geojensis TaxID=443610 RepID=A0A0F5FIS5_9HYPH|nr:hypothetical protein [Devosia geojensis]KKB08480.1 hypothetical protein VE25_18350 [Devosia geojensis]
MAGQKLAFGKLAAKDYAMGVAFVAVGFAIVFGLSSSAGFEIEPFLLVIASVVVGAVAWVQYLRKRDD